MNTFTPAAGWTIQSAGERAIRAISPMNLGLDGQHAAFFIAYPDEQSFYLTDACETAMHAAVYGIDLSSKRLEILNETPGLNLAQFDKTGAIVASGDNDQLQEALWEALKLAMALSIQCSKWMPRFNSLRFRAQVGHTLRQAIGEQRLLKAVKAQSSSGHLADFAYAVRSATSAALTYIEPIALKTGKKIDWTQVYQTHGKMSDVKLADQRNFRMVILEDGASAEEFQKAVGILEPAASVYRLAKTPDWQEVFAN